MSDDEETNAETEVPDVQVCNQLWEEFANSNNALVGSFLLARSQMEFGGDASGKNVVIIDDLFQTGGTLLETEKALCDAGAATVSAYLTHAVFPEDSWHKFCLYSEKAKANFDNFWITDFIPHARTIAKDPPFKLISLSSAIATTLLQHDLRT